jgi:hypothetical protein
MPFPLPGFPGVGPIGGSYVADGTGLNNAAEVSADNGLWVSGPWLVSILAELRVATYLLSVVANVPDSLSQLRADAVADMGTLYTVPTTTPVPSS